MHPGNGCRELFKMDLIISPGGSSGRYEGLYEDGCAIIQQSGRQHFRRQAKRSQCLVAVCLRAQLYEARSFIILRKIRLTSGSFRKRKFPGLTREMLPKKELNLQLV